MMRTIWAIAAGAAVMIATVAASPPDARRGRDAFEKRCTGCHSMDQIKVGPPLAGIYGRRAGMNPAFPYSDALRKARLTWDSPTLEKWLEDTESVAPGNDMAFRLADAEERRNIVKYLEQGGMRPRQQR